MFKFSDQTTDKTGKEFYKLANKFYSYSQNELGFDKDASCVLVSDKQNAQNPLGYTAYYDPEKSEVTIYADGRHIKDMLRSFSHELVHHAQACRGDLTGVSTEEGYAQKDEHMREMEREAYEKGNLIFRDWEDSIKSNRSDLTEEYGETDYTGATKPNGQRNVTYFTSKKMDANAEAHHRADVAGHNEKWELNNKPWFNKFEENKQVHENNQPSPISDEFKQDILSSLDLENPEESVKNWIGTAEWEGGEVSYFWVQRNKLFYLVEFSPTYGVDIKHVFGTWYQVNSAGLKNLRQHGKDAKVKTFNDIKGR